MPTHAFARQEGLQIRFVLKFCSLIKRTAEENQAVFFIPMASITGGSRDCRDEQKTTEKPGFLYKANDTRAANFAALWKLKTAPGVAGRRDEMNENDCEEKSSRSWRQDARKSQRK